MGTSSASVRIVSAANLHSPLEMDKRRALTALQDSLEETGVVLIEKHGIDPGLLEAAYRHAKKYFSQPEEVKRTYERAAEGHQRGHAPFGMEHAKDRPDLFDLKEFWHHGRVLPPGHPYVKEYGINLVVKEDPKFTQVMDQLYDCLDVMSMKMLESVSTLLGESSGWLPEQAREGDSILRSLHYPKTRGLTFPTGSIAAGKHQDVDLGTAIPPGFTDPKSSEPRLVIILPDGSELLVPGVGGVMVWQTGDMTDVLSGGKFPSTTHMVRNSEDPDSYRLSLPFFVHPPRGMNIATLPQFQADPTAPRGMLTAGRFLFQRLEEIGIYPGPNPYPV